jgi:hypothetical protein
MIDQQTPGKRRAKPTQAVDRMFVIFGFRKLNLTEFDRYPIRIRVSVYQGLLEFLQPSV